ncbi:MAG: arylsulfotransferase family protein [Nanoarchaeota archaeon]
MVNKKKLAGIIIFFLVLSLSYYLIFFDKYAWHQKAKINSLKYENINVSSINQNLTDNSSYIMFEDHIIDNQGNIINYWKSRSFIKLLSNGDIIAQNSFNSSDKLGRYTWDNEKVWEVDTNIHHDIALTNYNTILTSTKEFHQYNNRSVEFDTIIEYDLDGNYISNYSTWENLEELKRHYKTLPFDRPSSFQINKSNSTYSKKYPGDYDYFHLNSISVIGENTNSNDSRFKEGNWLISLRTPDLVIILDKDTKKVVWSYGPGILEGQHNPIILSSGNMIIYDNGGKKERNYTRVIEINPINKEIVWEYKDKDPESFYAKIVGTAQRLSNGNTLITYGTEANAFEVTPSGEKVWEFWTPNRYLNRSTIPNPYSFIYRAEIIDKEYVDSIIEDIKKNY